ncbi:m7GpppX diphosphatase isoform X1 [Takifugu flavidus]|nr:m7GpppX diphosphatase isoform X1 [Takifugu flavidus]
MMGTLAKALMPSSDSPPAGCTPPTLTPSPFARHPNVPPAATANPQPAPSPQATSKRPVAATANYLPETSYSALPDIHKQLGDQDAVVTLEKTPITEDTLTELFSGSTLSSHAQNDVYSTYRLQPPPHLNEMKVTVVCPATEEHLKKHQYQESYLVEETAEDYSSITLPYIESQSFSLQWVYNILEKKAEAERIVYEDPDPDVGFVLLPDRKWNQKQVDDLNLIAIVHQKGIRSIRGLTAEHLPLLKNVFQKGKEAIMKKYELPASKLRVYLHYQPSYYHLHVHFTMLGYVISGCGVEKAHLLGDVIQNLQSNPDYYKSHTLSFPLKAEDGLLTKFREAGKI